MRALSSSQVMLGLHLASNLKYKHTKATSIPDAALRANSALVGCFSQVTSGEILYKHSAKLHSCVQQAVGGP